MLSVEPLATHVFIWQNINSDLTTRSIHRVPRMCHRWFKIEFWSCSSSNPFHVILKCEKEAIIENTYYTSVLTGIKFHMYQGSVFVLILGPMARRSCELFKCYLSPLKGGKWKWGFTVCTVRWRNHAIFRGRRVLLKKGKKRTTGETPKWVFIVNCREKSA